MKLRLFWLLSLWLLGGCSAFAPKLETPRLSLVSASLVSADVFSQQFNVRLHVANPNNRDLPVKGLDYKLFLEGDSFAEGLSNTPFVVPALGEKEFDLSLRTNFVSSIGRLLSRLEGGARNKVRYEFDGKVMVDIPFVPPIPFAESGTIDLALQH